MFQGLHLDKKLYQMGDSVKLVIKITELSENQEDKRQQRWENPISNGVADII